MSDAPSPFVWYELLTTDEDAAKAFYPAVLGWGTEPFTGAGGDKPYTMWTANGAPLGGMIEKPPGSEGPPVWLGYIGVDDVDAIVRRAGELGAQTHVAPQDIPNVGRFAVLADPQGAMFAVYKSLNPQPAPGDECPPGNVSWHELATSDGGAAWGFYSALFGWQKTDSFDMGDGWMYDMFGYGGAAKGAVYTKPPDMPGPPAWNYYVRVEDLDGTVEKVKANGGQVIHGPMEVPGGDRIAIATDPQGAVFAMHALAARPA